MWASSQLTHSVWAGCACSSSRGQTDIPNICSEEHLTWIKLAICREGKISAQEEKRKKTPIFQDRWNLHFPEEHCDTPPISPFWAEHSSSRSTSWLPKTTHQAYRWIFKNGLGLQKPWFRFKCHLYLSALIAFLENLFLEIANELLCT